MTTLSRTERAKLRRRMVGKWVGCTTNRLLDALDAKDDLLADAIKLCEAIWDRTADSPPYDYGENIAALKERALEGTIHLIATFHNPGGYLQIGTECRAEFNGADLSTSHLTEVTCRECIATLAKKRPSKKVRRISKV